MKEFKILVIDDEKLIRWSFEKQFNSKGYKVMTAETGEEGIELFQNFYPHVVFIDNQLPKIQGLEVISKIKSIDEKTMIVFMTAYGSIDTAVEAMKRGAYEYVNKPFSIKGIESLILKIRNKIIDEKEIQSSTREKPSITTFDSIIGKSSVINRIIQMAKKIARTETSTILLLGESGTGKDLFAKSIHNESNRIDKPFVTINCSSLPETLLESELFGYEKGAFTDAKNQKKGLFEVAEGGTVFLDEIGEINLATQIKLLNVLENRTIRRVGGTVDIPIEIRIIAATNKNLLESIEQKLFREDLYYRLKVFQINLPPLREHKEDVILLAEHFIGLFNSQFKRNIKTISTESKELLKQYNWPGNTRELRNVMERAVILESTKELQADSLPVEFEMLQENIETISENVDKPYDLVFPDEGISLNKLEKQAIEIALKKTNYNQTKAASLLDISRDTLRYKIKKHNL